jgi:hypothetical protein
VKIAFVKQLPDPESYVQLVSDCAGAGIPAEANNSYERFLASARCVIAAYDGEKLVGIGGIHSRMQDTEFGGEWSATIRSEYKKRGLEANMKKIVGA